MKDLDFHPWSLKLAPSLRSYSSVCVSLSFSRDSEQEKIL